jgi:hypothetical protein
VNIDYFRPKKGWAKFLGDFFTKSSGHPGYIDTYLISTCIEIPLRYVEMSNNYVMKSAWRFIVPYSCLKITDGLLLNLSQVADGGRALQRRGHYI